MAEGTATLACPKGCAVPPSESAPKFCRHCGSNLVVKCPDGHENPPNAKFCRGCGVPLDEVTSAAAGASAERPIIPEPTVSGATTIAPSVTDPMATVRGPAEPIDPVGAAEAQTPQGATSPASGASPYQTRPFDDSTTQIPVTPPSGGPIMSPYATGSPPPRRRGGPWLVIAIVAGVVVLGLAGGLVYVLTKGSPSKSNGSASALVSHHNGNANHSGHSGNSGNSGTSPTVPVTQPTVPAEEQAAQSLSTLLTQSTQDRSAINAASDDVSACGNLGADVQTFNNAATSRQNLLAQLSTLQDGTALPALMVESLSGAWQASEQVDQDYASWASDEESDGCTQNDTSDPNYQAAIGPNQTATNDKTAFASAWDQIAPGYGLPTYQWNQL